MAYVDQAGKRHRYTPDFLLELEDHYKVVVEVKSSKYLDKSLSLFNSAAAELAKSGIAYFVITDQHLDRQRLERATLWRRYARISPPTAQVEEAIGLARASSVTVATLRAAGISMEAIYYLLGRRIFQAGADLIVELNTPLKLVSTGEPNGIVQFQRWFNCEAWRSNL